MKRTIITLMAIIAIFTTSLARQPQRGYRGFLDWSNSLHVEHLKDNQDPWNNGGSLTEFYTGFSTSHGYQFNPKFFLGAGLDYEHCSKISSNILAPTFKDVPTWYSASLPRSEIYGWVITV